MPDIDVAAAGRRLDDAIRAPDLDFPASGLQRRAVGDLVEPDFAARTRDVQHPAFLVATVLGGGSVTIDHGPAARRAAQSALDVRKLDPAAAGGHGSTEINVAHADVAAARAEISVALELRQRHAPAAGRAVEAALEIRERQIAAR